MNDILSVSLHRECFTRTCWTINEDGAVLTVYEGVTKILSIHFGEHFLLGRLRVKYLFEGVDFAFIPVKI